jgi:hypothetical protein
VKTSQFDQGSIRLRAFAFSTFLAMTPRRFPPPLVYRRNKAVHNSFAESGLRQTSSKKSAGSDPAEQRHVVS